MEIVRRYTRYFNRLNDRYEEFIETEEREDIFRAMQRLYEECVLCGERGQARKVHTTNTNIRLSLEKLPFQNMEGI